MIIVSTQASQQAETITPEQQALVREWLSFCHDRGLRRASVYVDFSELRDIGRWSCEKRARPFVVRSATTLDVLTSSKTFQGAMKLAAELSARREQYASR